MFDFVISIFSQHLIHIWILAVFFSAILPEANAFPKVFSGVRTVNIGMVKGGNF
jgi:membrane-anchored protein YejM (alkaline phosphatase superfamily)